MAANWPVRRVRKKLYNLEAKEVSMVDEPANLKKILVLKAANMNGGLVAGIKEAMASVDPARIEAADQVVASFGAEPVSKAAPTADTVAQGAQVSGEGGMTEEAQGALKAVARLLAPYIDQITDADMDALQESLGMRGSGGGADDDEPTDEPAPPAPPPPGAPAPAPAPAPPVPPRAAVPTRAPGARPPPQLRAVVRKDKKGDEQDDENADEAVKDADLTESEKKKYKAKEGGAMDEKSKEPVEKAATEQLEAISKRASQLEEQNKELVAKLAKQEADLAIEREDRLQREYLARAQREFENLDAQGVAKVLKSKHGDETGLKELEAVLKAANARVAAAEADGGLFGEIGSRAGSTSSGGGAQSKLDALVESTVQKSSGKSQEQVYREVLKTAEGRRLYAQAEKEAGRGIYP